MSTTHGTSAVAALESLHRHDRRTHCSLCLLPAVAARDQLILTHAATHNVRFAWEGHDEEIIADYEAKNIPPVPGAPFEWDMPARARTRQW